MNIDLTAMEAIDPQVNWRTLPPTENIRERGYLSSQLEKNRFRAASRQKLTNQNCWNDKKSVPSWRQYHTFY